MNKNLKFIISIILILVLVFLLSYLIVDFKKIKTYNLPTKKFTKTLSYSEAISTGNISNCKYLKDKNLENSCYLELVKCNDDKCYFDKGRYKKNVSLCFKIKNDTLRIACTASIRRSNILEESIVKNNISICEQFENSESIQHCKDNFYYGKRINENNKSYCNKIVNEVIKNECFK